MIFSTMVVMAHVVITNIFNYSGLGESFYSRIMALFLCSYQWCAILLVQVKDLYLGKDHVGDAPLLKKIAAGLTTGQLLLCTSFIPFRSMFCFSKIVLILSPSCSVFLQYTDSFCLVFISV